VTTSYPLTEPDLRAWFDRYTGTFQALVRGERSDPEAMTEFFCLPLTMVGDQQVTVLDRAGFLATWGAMYEQLAAVDYHHSTVERFEVTAYNDRALAIDAAGRRHTNAGTVLEDWSATYLVVGTDEGPRILALLSPPG